jgi:hypothetical protein
VFPASSATIIPETVAVEAGCCRADTTASETAIAMPDANERIIVAPS